MQTQEALGHTQALFGPYAYSFGTHSRLAQNKVGVTAIQECLDLLTLLSTVVFWQSTECRSLTSSHEHYKLGKLAQVI